MSWIRRLQYAVVFMAPSILVGAVIGSYPGYLGYKYVWEDADFCLSCHVHDYATIGWQKSVHGQTTTCHDCHHQPLRAYIHEAIVMIRDRPKFPQDLKKTPYVKNDLCESCHLSKPADTSTITGPMQFEDIAQIPKVDTSVLHKAHLGKKTNLELLNVMDLTPEERMAQPEPPKSLTKNKAALRDIACADCHGGPTNRGHNFSAVDMTCVRCHEQTHQAKFVKTYGCRSCHFQEFLAPVSQGSQIGQ